MKYLELYKEIEELGYLPQNNGLCYIKVNNHHLMDEEIFQMLKPEYEDITLSYWASEVSLTDYFHNDFEIRTKAKRKATSEFTGLRKNILLLCAALNGEL